MVKKFSNAQEVSMFSSSNVNFYFILSHVLGSDSEILKMNKKNIYLPSRHHLKGYFSKISCMPPPDPPRVTRLLTQSTAATKQSRGNTVF